MPSQRKNIISMIEIKMKYSNFYKIGDFYCNQLGRDAELTRKGDERWCG
jgi:hypothetical protein